MEGLQLRSLVTAEGCLELSLAREAVPEPGPDEVVLRVDAAPVNPTDMSLLLGMADVQTAKIAGSADAPILRAKIPAEFMEAMQPRVGQPLPAGIEGAGEVIKAGKNARHLVGKVVAVPSGGMYTQYRKVRASECVVLPEGVTAAEGASFANPLTVVGMVETARREGHTAMVHTAAASNLGQILVRACRADGIGLVNIVRRPAQVEFLRRIGAEHICDTSSPTFTEDLTQALIKTGATILFDAIGGGTLASDILTAMEVAITRTAKSYSRYGSTVHKQAYIYGALEIGPIVLSRRFGMAWDVGGWLLTSFLQKIGREEARNLRERVAREIKTTFASSYARVISLADVLQPDVVAAFNRKATGEKYLINPNLVR